MHGLSDFSALHDKCCLYALAHGYEIVVYGTHRQQRRYGGMLPVHLTVGEDDVVVSLVDTLFGILAQLVESVAQSVLPLAAFEEDRQLDGVEALVAYVAEDVKLCVRKDRVGQAYHLAV